MGSLYQTPRPRMPAKACAIENSGAAPGGSWGGEAGSLPQTSSPQVCPVTPNVTSTWSLPLGNCSTAQFSHQPGSFQKHIAHFHEQHGMKPTPAHRLSPGLSGLLCTTSPSEYQKGTTLPAAGLPLCKHGPKKSHFFFFFPSFSERRPQALPQENGGSRKGEWEK